MVQAETFSTGYGKPLTLTPAQLLAGDSDPQGGTLTVTKVSGTGATLNSNGTVTYTPPTQSVSGNAASFSYTVTDTAGLSSTATANISLTTAPPVVQAETFSTGYGKPLTLTPAQLLAGDSDPQGGTLTVTKVSGTGATLNSNGTVTYTPPTQSVSGNAASFSYTVTDTAGLSSTATANISLTTATPGGAGRDSSAPATANR